MTTFTVTVVVDDETRNSHVAVSIGRDTTNSRQMRQEGTTDDE